jgi:translation initiation factor 1
LRLPFPHELSSKAIPVKKKQLFRGAVIQTTSSKPISSTTIARAAARPGTPSQVRVGRETSGRRGKGVSVIAGLPLNDADLEALATRLKSSCGAGGSVKEGKIEIQGDHRDRLVEELKKLGYDAKRSGG